MRKIITNKYLKFSIAAIIYLLFVIWIWNFWLLLGLLVIFDYHITKYVNWTFWKKRDLEKKSALIEWIDAIVFAVIAALIIRTFFIEAYMIPTSSMEKTLLVGDYLFVSKYTYGPKMPNTPLAIPFTHHTIPGTKKSKAYLEWVKWPYKRLAGTSEIKRDDIVVFHFPEGDTVVVQRQNESYYTIIMARAEEDYLSDIKNNRPVKDFQHYYNKARELVKANYEITARPVDKRENYVKRCVAIAGDTLKIVNRQVYVNGKEQTHYPGIQYKYNIQTTPPGLNKKVLQKMNISLEDINMANMYARAGLYTLPLTQEMKQKIQKFKNVVSIEEENRQNQESSRIVFPHNPNYKWTIDNFGSLYIPKAQATVKLDTQNISIYERIITAYEGNKLKIENGKIFINDKETDQYTFKMNYYFMMGDSRHNSLDSRYWGFVPEDHIVGTPAFIWLSLDPDKSLFRGKIRFKRIFKIL